MDRRNRSPNYTEKEKQMLLDIIQNFVTIIENKRTDGTTNKYKLEAWEQVCIDYNSQQESGIRNIEQLKSTYDCLKRKARRQKTAEEVKQVDARSEKLIRQFNPLQNEFDADSFYNQNETEHKPTDIDIGPELSISLINETKEELDPLASTSTNIKRQKKNINKVYEGLENLTNKRIKRMEIKDNYLEKNNELELKCAELDFKIREEEFNTIRKKSDAEEREAKLRESILRIDLETAKVKLEIEKRKLEDLK